MVGGCLAQKDRGTVVERAPHVDVVLGTHNVHRAADLLHEARAAGRSVVEILEETVADDHDAFPSALPVRREVPWAAWVTIQIGCDNACAFCIVPAVRGREISRRPDDIVEEVRRVAADGVTEVTLLGQNVNSYGRDLSLAARQAAGEGRVRPLFADLLRAVGAVEGIRRVRYTSPHPKDLRPETIAAMAETPSVCEHLHLPLQSGSDRVLAAMHRGYTAERYLERLAAPGRPSTTWPSPPTSSWASRARPTTTSSAPSRWPPRPPTTAPTPSSTAPAPAPRRPSWSTSTCPPTWWPSASSACGSWWSARVWPGTRPAWAAPRRSLVEGPSRKDPAVLTGRTRQNKLVHFAAEPIRPGSYATVRVTGAAPHHLRGELVEVTRGAAHKTRLPLLVG